MIKGANHKYAFIIVDDTAWFIMELNYPPVKFGNLTRMLGVMIQHNQQALLHYRGHRTIGRSVFEYKQIMSSKELYEISTTKILTKCERYTTMEHLIKNHFHELI